MITIKSFPLALLLFLLLTAISMFAAFWLMRNYVRPLIKSRKHNRLTTIWLFRLELLFWSGFISLALYWFLVHNLLLTCIFLVLALLLIWPFLKDFVPGILFRLEHQITKGDIIRLDGQESSVEAIGWRHLSSSNAAGETILTPYHRLSSAVIVRARAAGKLVKHSFNINLQETDPLKAALLIKKYFLECPWSASLQLPVVKNMGDGTYQITAFAADKFAAEKQKIYLNWRIGQTSID